MAPPRRILPVIIGSQFAGTSLWFGRGGGYANPHGAIYYPGFMDQRIH